MKDNMKHVLRTIFSEFWQRDLPKLVPRTIAPPPQHPHVRKAWVLMGMRRSGKTWTAFQQIQERLKLGLGKETNLYINFEDDRLMRFEASDFQLILDVYFELHPQHLHEPNLFFCFDEIHVIPGWEKFIRRLIDTEKMSICVTGSSAEMLSKELGTTLGGRAWPQEVFPFSFSEFLHFHHIEVLEDAKTKAHIRHLAEQYLLYGGFPEAIIESKELHTSLIQGYMDAVILRDIIKRHSIGNANLLQRFFIQILRQLAAPLSVTKIYQTFKSMNISVGKNTLFEYLQYIEDSYAIFSVPFFSLSERIRQVNPKKIYAIDPGVITAYSVKIDYEKASRFENAVFMHLRRSFKNICYYKTGKNQKEIDFVVTTPIGNLLLIQACIDMSPSQTRERELSALYEACAELDIKEGFVISEDHEEIIERNGISIYCVPFWQWAQSQAINFPDRLMQKNLKIHQK